MIPRNCSIIEHFSACLIAVTFCAPACFGQLTFTDITLGAGTGGPTAKDKLGGHGVMFADADQDGLPDLYITMIFNKPMPELFFRNLGKATFADESASRRIADFDGGSHGGCWADLDNDGDYDLVDGTTWDNPDYPNHNNIFRNDGHAVFTDVTPECMRRRTEATRGTICFDADRDGDLDIFCVSGWMGSGDSEDERNEGNAQIVTFTTCGRGAVFALIRGNMQFPLQHVVPVKCPMGAPRTPPYPFEEKTLASTGFGLASWPRQNLLCESAPTAPEGLKREASWQRASDSVSACHTADWPPLNRLRVCEAG